MSKIVDLLMEAIATIDRLDGFERRMVDGFAYLLTPSEWEATRRIASQNRWTLSVIGASVQEFNSQPLENRMALINYFGA